MKRVSDERLEELRQDINTWDKIGGGDVRTGNCGSILVVELLALVEECQAHRARLAQAQQVVDLEGLERDLDTLAGEYADALSAIVRGRAEDLHAQGRPYPYTLAIGEACAVLATVSGSLVRYAEAEREREKREREKEVPDA